MRSSGIECETGLNMLTDDPAKARAVASLIIFDRFFALSSALTNGRKWCKIAPAPTTSPPGSSKASPAIIIGMAVLGDQGLGDAVCHLLRAVLPDGGHCRECNQVADAAPQYLAIGYCLQPRHGTGLQAA